MSDDGHTDPGGNASARLRTEAIVRHGWWPGWIWAVPIAALLIVGWLGLRDLTRGGENIQINFEKAYGIKPQDTDVVYRGVKVGTVTSVALNDKGDAVIVTIAETHAGEWRVSLADNTTGKSYNTTVAHRSSYSSAEWVEEMPSLAQAESP